MRVAFRAHGKVQGVSYRNHACQHARILSLAGWVRNESDGTVVGEVEGNLSLLEAFRVILTRGSIRAQVSRLDWQEVEGAQSLPTVFTIR